MGGTKLCRNRHHLKGTRASFQPLILLGTGNSESSPEQAENRASNQLVSKQHDTSAENQAVENQLPAMNQPEPQQEIPTTHSGRAVIKPAKYSDYLYNSTSVDQEEYFV